MNKENLNPETFRELTLEEKVKAVKEIQLQIVDYTYNILKTQMVVISVQDVENLYPILESKLNTKLGVVEKMQTVKDLTFLKGAYDLLSKNLGDLNLKLLYMEEHIAGNKILNDEDFQIMIINYHELTVHCIKSLEEVLKNNLLKSLIIK